MAEDSQVANFTAHLCRGRVSGEEFAGHPIARRRGDLLWGKAGLIMIKCSGSLTVPRSGGFVLSKPNRFISRTDNRVIDAGVPPILRAGAHTGKGCFADTRQDCGSARAENVTWTRPGCQPRLSWLSGLNIAASADPPQRRMCPCNVW